MSRAASPDTAEHTHRRGWQIPSGRAVGRRRLELSLVRGTPSWILHKIDAQPPQTRRRQVIPYVALSVVEPSGSLTVPTSEPKRPGSADQGAESRIDRSRDAVRVLKRIADDATEGTTVRVPLALIQPWRLMNVANASPGLRSHAV